MKIMKIYVKPNILCMAIMSKSHILDTSAPLVDEEGEDEGSYGNDTGRNRKGYGVWDDEEDEEEEDY